MRLALCGLGRAGSQVLRLAMASDDVELAVAFCRNGSKRAGKTLSDVMPVRGVSTPIYQVSEADEVFLRDKPQVLIDFSNRQATMQLLPVCAKHKVHMVICTTNFSSNELCTIRQTAANTPGFALVLAPNVTLGVNVLMLLCEQVARCLPDFDYAITEKHHNLKADVSATAKKISDVLEATLGKPVPVNSIRAGGYVGLHEVLAVNDFERITIIHESFSRQAFASGAVLAARHVIGKEGYFEMSDIIAAHLGVVLNDKTP